MRRISVSVLLLVFVLGFSMIGYAGDLPGLVVYFDFEQGKGDTADDGSGLGNHGDMKGGVSWGEGKFGGGMEFDGADGTVEVLDNETLQFSEGLTIAAWIKPTLTGNEWQLIGSKGPDAAEFFEVLLNGNTGVIWMGWTFVGAGRIVPAQAPPLVQADVWQHVAVAWDPKEFWNVYLDGEIIIEHPQQDDELQTNSDPLILGTELNMKRHYSGLMDDWALFSRGLTQEEIQEVMEGIGDLLAVDGTGKLATTWGDVKSIISN